MMDNTTAISYINKIGEPTSLVLSSLACNRWKWGLERSITVEAHHLWGRLNNVANFQSQAPLDTSNWQLDPATSCYAPQNGEAVMSRVALF